MQFFNPGAFHLLWLLPLLGVVFIFGFRIWEKRLGRFGNFKTLASKLMPGHRSTQRIRPFYLILVFLFAILALARPQWGEEKKKVERKGINIIFLLDTSLSMLAEDVKPNRLEKSKLEIKSFIRRLKGDRVGMVAFAGSGFLQSPLTLDYAAFLLFLDAVKTGYIPDPGTSLDRAIRLAVRSFPEKEIKYKSLILFTDGEDHEGGIGQSLEEAKKAGVRIYAIGLGTAEGSPIPLRDESGKKGGFKKDREGQVVITKLDRALLEKMAAETGGLYLPSTLGEQEVDVVLKHLSGLGQKKFKERVVTEREDHFQFFLFWSLFFLIVETLVRHNKKVTLQAVSLLAVFLFFSGFLESPRTLNEKGNQEFKEKKYQSALESYRKAGIKKPDDPAIRYNLATTLYKVNEYQEASQSLEKSIEQAKDPALRAQAFYNFANTQYRLGNFEKAIEAYQKALEINPKDVDAKYNLEFLQKEKSQFEKKNQERKKDQQQQQQNQQPQDQQKNQKSQQNQQPQDQEQSQGEQGQSQSGGQDQEEKEQQQEKESQSEEQKDQQEQKMDQQQEQGDEEPENQRQEEEQESEPEQLGEGRQEKQQPSQGQDQKGMPRPLQGQMTMENALRILDAMKDSEKELQDLRRPPVNKEPPPVAKDW